MEAHWEAAARRRASVVVNKRLTSLSGLCSGFSNMTEQEKDQILARLESADNPVDFDDILTTATSDQSQLSASEIRKGCNNVQAHHPKAKPVCEVQEFIQAANDRIQKRACMRRQALATKRAAATVAAERARTKELNDLRKPPLKHSTEPCSDDYKECDELAASSQARVYWPEGGRHWIWPRRSVTRQRQAGERRDTAKPRPVGRRRCARPRKGFTLLRQAKGTYALEGGARLGCAAVPDL